MRKLIVTKKPIPKKIIHSGKGLLCFGSGSSIDIKPGDNFWQRVMSYELVDGIPSGWGVWHTDPETGYVGRSEDILEQRELREIRKKRRK